MRQSMLRNLRLGKISDEQVKEISSWALSPFEKGSASGSENPFQIQTDLQEEMQKLVGIVRTEAELTEAIQKIKDFGERINKAGCAGNRAYNPGWHTAMELKHMITVAEAIARAAIGAQRKSWWALPRRFSAKE